MGAIKSVFDTVQAGKAEYGVVPFENSTHGIVTFTLDALADRGGAYPNLTVCAEIYLPVHHFLLGRRSETGEAVSQETDLSHVKKVYSHPQGFGQTAAFFAKHLPGAETIDVSSTSRAAELAAQDTTGSSAAVSSVMAAEVMGLDILARNIQDRDDNTTRFLVIRRGAGEIDDSISVGDGSAGSKSLVSFTVPHTSPGALADVLECFRRGGLNLTSINSLPSLVRPFQYLFFAEFEGSRLKDSEGRVQGVLDDVGRVARSWRWLGSWEVARLP